MSGASSSSGQYGAEIASRYKGLKSLVRGELECQLEALGDRRLRSLVRRVVDDDACQEKKSKLMQEKENYRIYEVLSQDNTTDAETDADDHQQQPLVTMKGVLLLQNSSCEEVMELLAETATSADLFGAMYVDSTVLYQPPPPPSSFHQLASQSSQSSSSRASSLSSTPLASSTSFHWLMLRDVSAQLPMRDFLFMKYNQSYASDDVHDPHRIGWGASVWESVQFKSCPPLWDPAAVSRRCEITKWGFIVEASDHSNATRVTFFVTAPVAPQEVQVQANRQWLLKLAACVRFIPSAIVNHRIRNNKLVDKKNWISKDACGLCTQSFSKMFRRQHHCRMCGSSVCGKCTLMRHQETVRVCLSCINGEDTSALWGKVRMARKKLGTGTSTSSITGGSTVGTSTSSSWDVSASASHSHSGIAKESWSSSSPASFDLPQYNHSLDSSTRSGSSSSYSYARPSALEDFLEGGGDPFFKPKLSSSTGSMSMSMASTTSSVDEDDAEESSLCSYPLTYAKGNPWPDAPMPPREAQRLQRIKTLNLSQQYAKESLHELLDLARTSISCPVAAVAIVSVSTVLLVTSVGLAGDQLPRDVGFEAHTIMASKPLIVLDSQKDERFAMNPLVSAMNIRFYIGLPLITRDGTVVGALSLGDTSPRDRVSGADVRSLQRLAARIVAKMDAGNEPMDNATATTTTRATTLKVGGVLLI